jgi:hypothetical protein
MNGQRQPGQRRQARPDFVGTISAAFTQAMNQFCPLPPSFINGLAAGFNFDVSTNGDGWFKAGMVVGLVLSVGLLLTGPEDPLADADYARLAFPGGLKANDLLGGGHVLEEHVGLDDAALRARGLPAASTFIDRAAAESALADVQAARSSEIASWLAGAKPDAVQAFRYTFDHPVGQILYRGSEQSVSGSTAVAVLRADPSSPIGYYLHTGYVDP